MTTLTQDERELLHHAVAEHKAELLPLLSQLGFRPYEIADQTYDREIEKWEFEPGEQVVCELVDSDDGLALTAKRHA